MKKLIFLPLIFLTVLQLSAQNKYEQESKISFTNVPEKARLFVSKIIQSKKVKWYKEQSNNGISFEAKSKFKGEKYSIEFDTNGTIEDIEIEKKWNDLPKTIQQNIINSLQNTFIKHKIRKIQIQFSAEEKDLINYFKDDVKNNITVKYEIVVKGKSDSGKHLFELLFNHKGQLEATSKIVFRNTDNIEF
ncbi:hypothetical protein [Mesoflavibacter zeaxanthinifaciens]|uniref:hypothetical protein n=1 Tax=Mesoflavibacter zeaxanthinifaciens TaxID=393060 RepID=UPI0004082153|nr:hypothetical protein [Mesoflavibacter zeaxanthinifaciens]